MDLKSIDSIRAVEAQTGKKLYQRVLKVFEQEMEIKLPELSTAYQQADANKVALTAHAIKSLAANVGAKKLRHYCLLIEQAGKNNELNNCEMEVAELENCYQQTLPLLNEQSGSSL